MRFLVVTAIVVLVVVILPLAMSRASRRYGSSIDDYLDEQHSDGSARRINWPNGY